MRRSLSQSAPRLLAPWALILIGCASLLACGSCGSNPNTPAPKDPPPFAEPDPELVAFGAQLYRTHGCVTCHTIDGRPSTAPTFLGAFGETRVMTNGRRAQVNEDYLRRSIREPSTEIVAGYTNQMIRYTPEMVSEYELNALIAFIVSLRDQPGDPTPTEQPADPSLTPDPPKSADPAPDPASNDTPKDPAKDDTKDAAQDEPSKDDSPPATPLRLRNDGRPEWWLDHPIRRDTNRAALSAEALGETFRGASDRALEEARRQLRLQLNLAANAPIPDEQIERTLVLPLPNPGGAYRFVGYVLVSGKPTP